MTSGLQFKLHDASILMVPSVHFRLAFVEEVNRVCSAERPDAVAVELGPQTAAAATAWLTELEVRPGGASMPLPCMLGLIKPNRRIRPGYRAAAIRLQQWMGKELHELSPELLHQHLNYSAVSTLPLSSADSIIEAMRCALELNVPLYGIDLEDTAVRQQKEIMVQDPTLAADGFADYVTRNAEVAEEQRDEEIDSRRELAMAARLKGLSQKHRRIVFVCGLAHWRKLLTLLETPDLRPAPYPQVSAQELNVFQRVVMHPMLAIYHLDTFPVFSETYENERRRSASQPRARYGSSREWWPHGVFLSMLEETYRKHFTDVSGEQLDRAFEDLEAKSDFEQLLRNFCTLRQRLTPDIYSSAVVAKGVMSEKFCDRLIQTFMDIQWAPPRKFPDLPILAPSPLPAELARPNDTLRAELVYSDGQSSSGFFVQSLPGRSGIPMNIPLAWKWGDAPQPQLRLPDGYTLETWVPTEDLINAFLFQAVRLARQQSRGHKIEVFEGSLLDGVHMKTTLRSAARGEDRVYVRTDNRHLLSSDADIDGFPVVWIFRLNEAEEPEWRFSGDELERLSQLAPEGWTAGLPKTGWMITSMAACIGAHDDETLSTPDYAVRSETILGKLSYWPQCCQKRTAEWAVETALTRNPVCSGPEFDALIQHYRERYGFEVGQFPWHVTLIRMAIPLAKKAVTVVAPDGYVLPGIVYKEAALKHIQLRSVPLSFFPSHVLRRMSHLVWLPVLRREFDETGIDFPIYPEHIKRYFNERMDTYRRLIPAKWH
jgi:hypothetical protein